MMDSTSTTSIPLPPFQLLKLRADMRWQRPESIPGPIIANVLRGAVGIVFRKLVCPTEWFNEPCPPCALYSTCHYGQLFMPTPPADSGVLKKQQDIPRPFVIEPPGLASMNAVDDRKLSFHIVLFGKAIEALPLFVTTLERLCSEGMGKNRTKLELERVVAEHEGQHENLFDPQSHVLTRPTLLYSDIDCSTSPMPTVAQSPKISIRFTTPLLLKSGSHVDADGRSVPAREVREAPPFHVLVSRLRDRLSSLSAFFGQRWQADFKGMGDRAHSVATASSNVMWLSRNRRSTRTGHSHEISGLVGQATYQFQCWEDLQFYWPLLKVGELIHVGKSTPWGNGAMKLESVPFSLGE